jgi:preprotein translocase subunit SecF
VEAHEAVERFERSHHVSGMHGEEPSFTMQAALTVAILAAFLAVATFLTNETVKEAIQNETKAADKNSESTSFDTQTEVAQLDGAILRALSVSSDRRVAKLSDAAADELEKHDKQFEKAAERFDEKAHEAKAEVDDANEKHLLYELAVVALQIGIVLASVSIIARRRFLLAGSTIAGVVGVVVLAIGLLH